MNYIVFDLEWNQCPYGPSGTHPRMPFEIIEIGAVKLDEDYNLIGKFNELIRPKLYPKFHKAIKSMLNYTEKELKEKGRPFPEVCQDFLDFCGDDYRFATWGTSDLPVLQNNMDFYHMNHLGYPVKYYDIQQIYAQKYMEDKNNVCKLEKAVIALDIPEDIPYHAAINDSIYTARVLKAAKLGDITEHYIYDIYRHPKNDEEEVHDRHGLIIDEIFQEYESKRKAMQDKRVTDLICVKCGRRLKKKIAWFQNNPTTWFGVGKCLYHGNMMGVLKVRSTKDSEDGVFIVKNVHKINKQELERVKKRQETVLEKKKAAAKKAAAKLLMEEEQD